MIIAVVGAGGKTTYIHEMAKKYAEHYGLIPFAGSDNHHGAEKPRLAGLCFKTPVKDENDFINKIKKSEGCSEVIMFQKQEDFHINTHEFIRI